MIFRLLCSADESGGSYQRSGESYRAGEYRSSHRAHFSLHRGQGARMVRDNDDLPRPDRSFGLFL